MVLPQRRGCLAADFAVPVTVLMAPPRLRANAGQGPVALIFTLMFDTARLRGQPPAAGHRPVLTRWGLTGQTGHRTWAFPRPRYPVSERAQVL